jgi:hypothetical protein
MEERRALLKCQVLVYGLYQCWRDGKGRRQKSKIADLLPARD